MRKLLILLLLLASPLAAEDWQPEKTWVFAVGILEFEADISGWPEEGRVDAEMIEAYKQRGVPEDQIVFLKNEQGTKKAIGKGLAELAAKAAEDDTLVFYYAGHGVRNYQVEERPVAIVPYDSKPGEPKSDLPVERVFKIIESNFKGTRVFLTVDSCHSGAFAEVAKTREDTEISYAALTSAHVSSQSTGNWTYTECLVDMLNGNALLDTDGDGKVTLKEASVYTEKEMAFGEEQLSSFAASDGFGADTVMASAGEKPKEGVGLHLEAKDEGKWYRAKVLDVREGEYYVHWIGFDDEWDRWVKVEETRAYEAEPKFEVATRVEVEWDGTWYEATIVKTHLGLHYVHYKGYPEADDEWVPRNRIRLPKETEDGE
jgi:hypothetical protein